MTKCKFWDTCALASEIYAWCLYEDRSKQCSFWEQNEQEAKKAKANGGDDGVNSQCTE